MRTFLVTVIWQDVRREYTAKACCSCDAVIAALAAYPSASSVSAKQIDLH